MVGISHYCDTWSDLSKKKRSIIIFNMEFLRIIFVLTLRLSPVFSVSQEVEQLLEEMSGSHLRFSASPIPSLLDVRRNRNGTFSYSGFHVEVVEFVARVLNISYSFVNVNEAEVELLGLKEASIALVMRNEVEVVTYGMTVNLDHCTRMDCAFPLTTISLGMLVPWPEEGSRILAVSQPFQPMVWLSIFVSCVAMVLALVGIPGIYFKFIQEKICVSPSEEIAVTSSFSSPIWSLTRLGDATVYVATIFTSQGNWAPFKHLSLRILLATVCLSAFVIVNAYSSTLISYLTASKLPATKTFEELASRSPQDLTLITDKNTPYSELFLNAESGSLKVLGDSLRSEPDTLFTNRVKGFNLLSTGKCAYVAWGPLVYAFMDAANKKAGYCKFTVSNNFLTNDTTYAAYTYPKNWRYTHAIQHKVLSLWESGLMDHWFKMYQPSMTKCSLEKYKDTTAKHKILSKMDLLGCFILLGLGLSLAFLVFLIERIVTLAKKIRE